MASGPFFALCFSFVLSAGAVSLRLEEGKDLMTTKRHQQDDKCACIAWKDVYSKHGVQCGASQEYATYGVTFKPMQVDGLGVDAVDSDTKTEWCTKFFEKFSANSCVNERLGQGIVSPYNRGHLPVDKDGNFILGDLKDTSSRQWCYVSSECASASHNVSTLSRESGSVELNDVSVKFCDESAGDKLMSTKTPEEINSMAETDSIDVGLFAKLSYPVNQKFKWSQVESASVVPDDVKSEFHDFLIPFQRKYNGPQPASAAAAQELKDVMASGVATIFDEDNGHGGGAVVMGNKIYAFKVLHGEKVIGNVWRYKCMFGCGA